MNDEMIARQSIEIKEIISTTKYKLKFIDKKKLADIKKLYRKSHLTISAPCDIATVNDILDVQIKKCERDLTTEHKYLPVMTQDIDIPLSDALGWIDITISNLNKWLKKSFFIDYASYKKYRKKDINGIISDNYILCFDLQQKKIEANLNFVIESYRRILEILQKH